MADAFNAVRVTSIAREHARTALDRLINHLRSGNVKGVRREVSFLNALERQTIRLSGGVAPRVGLGTRALKAVSGPRSRYARASMLATFTDNSMVASRNVVVRQIRNRWIWTANQTACAACLLEHGTRHSGIMSPLHPSCLCIPDRPGLARELTTREIGQLMVRRGGRDARFGQLVLDGELARDELLIEFGGIKVQRNRGLPLLKPARRQAGTAALRHTGIEE